MASSKWWIAVKGVWAVIITLLTALSTYGQYYSASVVLRPTLSVQLVAGTPEVKKAFGERSHVLAIRNSGSLAARDIRTTVVTRFGGQVVHQDIAHQSQTLNAGTAMAHEVHVHDEQMKSFSANRDVLIEEVTISYRGRGGVFRVWCTPIYTHAVTYKLQPSLDRWVYERDPAETEDCD